MMKELSSAGICNHVANLASMLATEMERREKHANNSRCKPPNWGTCANYFEYAFGVGATCEEMERLADRLYR